MSLAHQYFSFLKIFVQTLCSISLKRFASFTLFPAYIFLSFFLNLIDVPKASFEVKLSQKSLAPALHDPSFSLISNAEDNQEKLVFIREDFTFESPLKISTLVFQKYTFNIFPIQLSGDLHLRGPPQQFVFYS